ncbi:MAG: hypothetical protein AUJ07_00370 [Crenarchaeota archaeon 13_1_40CM_3_53_5]|nr:MAG: hypothetical protein AUJ07_00370 [Crenarchaeota archaeon 13_1_40CM_3_53_5]
MRKQELSFQAKTRKFVRDHIAPIGERIESEEEGTFETLSKLGQHGLLGAPFSQKDGGAGLGWSCEIIFAEEVSAVSAAAEMARLASAALYATPLAYFGREQKQEFLAPVLSWKKIGATALTADGR